MFVHVVQCVCVCRQKQNIYGNILHSTHTLVQAHIMHNPMLGEVHCRKYFACVCDIELFLYLLFLLCIYFYIKLLGIAAPSGCGGWVGAVCTGLV